MAVRPVPEGLPFDATPGIEEQDAAVSQTDRGDHVHPQPAQPGGCQPSGPHLPSTAWEPVAQGGQRRSGLHDESVGGSGRATGGTPLDGRLPRWLVSYGLSGSLTCS
jgi:hypothetical protein